ncbi:uncharacterized protein AB675_11820 [Cyphellophora attinorum]|uniref:Uncharacterized protein n=1 Tax=Cyphellophora attinorum TaxID=1664694 RepID=A0A0N0NJA9_9EURO|nr:uncharacterized protein AB675_11820 [Phialophora attinorum]KPI36771.1 hypothetical protein AB675_11820 [Phialophora attinorum]
MPLLDSPTRRVLGDKPTNTPIYKQSLTKPTKDSHVSHQNQQRQSQSVKAGLKRSIEEVEDAERVDSDDSQRSTGTQILSFLNDADEDSSADNAASMLVRQSQQEAAPVETTFEIIEEAELSQHTRESLSAVPMPQNASQPTGLRPLLLPSLSQLSAGMSSFVDFDQSQQDDLKPLPATEESAIQQPPETEQPEEESIAKKAAAQLRTRLQLAMYKVTTNQTTVPFSRLKSPTSARRTHFNHDDEDDEDYPMSSSPMPSSSPAAPQRPSPETRIHIRRVQAAMQAKRPVRDLATYTCHQ